MQVATITGVGTTREDDVECFATLEKESNCHARKNCRD